MSAKVIYFITEGATEREVGLALIEKGLLKNARVNPGLSKFREGDSVITEMVKENILQNLRNTPGLTRLFLIFDQESFSSPIERARWIGDRLGVSFSPAPARGYVNVFENKSPDLHIVLHISDAAVEGISNRDFDGYLLRLLQGPYKAGIVTGLTKATRPEALLRKAEQEIPRLMLKNGLSWTHNKSWLYAYITVLQYRQSHVWFAKDVVKAAPEEALQQTFASLIAAWNLLTQGEDGR